MKRTVEAASSATVEAHQSDLMLMFLGGFLIWVGWFGFAIGNSGFPAQPTATLMLNVFLGCAAALIGSILSVLVVPPHAMQLGSTLPKASTGGLPGLVAMAAGMDMWDPF